jgi:hypothetical protein
MRNLAFDGIAVLDTAGGVKIRTLKFRMTSSTTDGFRLATTDEAGRNIVLTSSALTIEQDVQFYTSRFTGNLGGVIPVTLTPDLPLPPLPIEVDIFFTDPDIELVYVQCGRLEAKQLQITTPA